MDQWINESMKDVSLEVELVLMSSPEVVEHYEYIGR